MHDQQQSLHTTPVPSPTLYRLSRYMDFVNHSPACLEAKARPNLERHMAKAYLLARLSTVRPSKYTPQLASEQVPLAPR
jgi:hypothetical protein